MMKTNTDAQHKLVVFGDSLSQGFNNGGIYRTDINFPAFLIKCMEGNPAFEQPRFTAQAGLPLNLEVLVRGLSEKFGDNITWNEYVPAALHMISTLRHIKKYWDGRGADLSVQRNKPYHNQSVWGFSISDSWVVNEKNSREYIQNNKESFTVFDLLPQHAKFTTARLVLNPAFHESLQLNTQLDNVHLLHENGGIENLIACMGHNNIMGAVTDLKIVWTEGDELESFPANQTHTIYRPEHFERVYRKMAEKIAAMRIKRVFVPTIPYVTIPPVCRGVNSAFSSQKFGYFDYYTRFWIWDEEFDPARHPHLTKDEAIQLDLTVDEYNTIIRNIAREYGWHIVPMAKNVAGMAYRRYGGQIARGFPPELSAALKRNPATAYLVDENGKANLTTDYLRLNDEGKIYKGGIFSLDGIHPTTIGYGLMAHIYMQAMKRAGVAFEKELDWDVIIAEDSLISNPPLLLKKLRFVLRYLAMGHQERFFDFGKNILGQVVDLFSPRH